MNAKEMAVDMILRRTDLSDDDADYYASIAMQRIRSYLSLGDDADLSDRLFAISDIAVLMYQSDTASKNAGNSLGYKSESVSEGGISKSVTAYSGSEISSSYNAQIDDILAGLLGLRLL